MTIHLVSCDFVGDRATRERGESYPALSRIEACYRLLLKTIAEERAAGTLSGASVSTVMEFEEQQRIASHESSFLAQCALAKDDYSNVVSIRRSPRLEVVT